MTTPVTNVGGDFDRLIRYSVWYAMEDFLGRAGPGGLAWIGNSRDENGTGNYQPVIVVEKPLEVDEEAAPNLIGFRLGTAQYANAELGSYEQMLTVQVYVDIFAENDTIGRMLRGDLISAFLGLRPDVGRSTPILDIIDPTQATPTTIVTAEIERVLGDQASGFRDWRRFWFTVEFELEIPPTFTVLPVGAVGGGGPGTDYGSGFSGGSP